MQTLDLANGYPILASLEKLNAEYLPALRAADLTNPAPFAGIPELRETIAARLTAEGIPTHAEELLVTNGGTQALYYALSQLTREADAEVLLPLPQWGYFPTNLEQLGVKFRTVQLTPGQKITPAQLRENLNERTHLFILTNPGNPDGTVYSPSEIRALGRVLEDFPKVYILSDEVYYLQNFTEQPDLSFAALPALRDRTLLVRDTTKSLGLTSWRVGYVRLNENLRDAWIPFHQMNTYGTSKAAQIIYHQAMQREDRYRAVWHEEVLPRMDDFTQRLGEVFQTEVSPVRGAYFALVELGNHLDIDHLPERLQRQFQLLVADGTPFGAAGYYRMNLARNEAYLMESLARLHRFVQTS